jgi:hypothetical protein
MIGKDGGWRHEARTLTTGPTSSWEQEERETNNGPGPVGNGLEPTPYFSRTIERAEAGYGMKCDQCVRWQGIEGCMDRRGRGGLP